MYYNALVFKFTAKHIRSFGDRNSELLGLPAGNPTSAVHVLLNHILRRILYNIIFPNLNCCNVCVISSCEHTHSHSAPLNTSFATISLSANRPRLNPADQCGILFRFYTWITTVTALVAILL